MIVNSFNGQPYRRHQRLQTLFLLLELVTSEKNESLVSRTNALLVGTLISLGDFSVSIAVRRTPP